MTIYKGYEVRRNSLDKKLYAYPVGDIFTYNRIVRDTTNEMKEAIDSIQDNLEIIQDLENLIA